jgi:RNA polymerase sigma-70 factor (ECF subfamily)
LEELNFSAWLFRVASNTINDHFRKIYREPNISELDEKAINVPSSDSPQKNLIRKDDKTQLQSAFSKLPENYREILELRFIQEFNLKETCEILGRNSVSVRVLQYRALSKLKNILNSEYGFSGEKIQ